MTIKEPSLLEDLYRDVEALEEGLERISQHKGAETEILVAAVKAQIKILYRNTIAEICGIAPEEVTDEYIEVAQRQIPTGGYDPATGTIWDGTRPMTDFELIILLNPLIMRDREARKKESDFADLIDKLAAKKDNDPVIIYDEKLSTVKEPYMDYDETLSTVVEPYMPYVDELSTVKAPQDDRMARLHETINQMIEYYEQDGLTDEERVALEDEANVLSRQTIAGIMGVDPEVLPQAMVNAIMAGKKAQHMTDGKLVSFRVPYTDEEVKGLVGMISWFDKPINEMIREYEESVKDTADVAMEMAPAYTK